MTENEISRVVVEGAIEVHRTVGGPGLLENIYLRQLDLRLGLVINFGERLVKDGIHRVVNGL